MQDAVAVVFRADRIGVFALFPFLPGTNNPSTCMAYAAIGQHYHATCVAVVRKSWPATRKQYAPLLKELRRIGYKNIRVLKRIPRTAYAVRLEQCR